MDNIDQLKVYRRDDYSWFASTVGEFNSLQQAALMALAEGK